MLEASERRMKYSQFIRGSETSSRAFPCEALPIRIVTRRRIETLNKSSSLECNRLGRLTRSLCPSGLVYTSYSWTKSFSLSLCLGLLVSVDRRIRPAIYASATLASPARVQTSSAQLLVRTRQWQGTGSPRSN